MAKEFRPARNDNAILAVLEMAGAAGLSADDIAEVTEIRPADVRLGLSRLVAAFMVAESVEKMSTTTGRAKIYWHPSFAALQS